MDHAKRKRVFERMQTANTQIRLRICASVQSNQGLRCPQTETLATLECFNGDQIPGWDFARVQDNENTHFLRMLKDTFFARRSPYEIGYLKSSKVNLLHLFVKYML